MGRIQAIPKNANTSASYQPPILEWYKLSNKEKKGEILAAFEILRVIRGNLICIIILNDYNILLKVNENLPPLPPKDGEYFIVPNEIRPKLKRTAVEILAVGLRNLKKFQFSHVDCPSLEFEIGGSMQKTNLIKNLKKNPYFEKSILFFDTVSFLSTHGPIIHINLVDVAC